MKNVLCRSNVEPIESQGIWYNIAIVLLGVPSKVLVKLGYLHYTLPIVCAWVLRLAVDPCIRIRKGSIASF